MSSGEFPSILKTAKVVPIFKKGSTDLVENYRPMSVLSSLSKLYEFQQINKYLCTQQLLSSNQYSFEKSNYTETAISMLLIHIYNAVLITTCLLNYLFINCNKLKYDNRNNKTK